MKYKEEEILDFITLAKKLEKFFREEDIKLSDTVIGHLALFIKELETTNNT